MSVLKRKDGQVDLSGGEIHLVSGGYEAKRRNEMYLRLHQGEIEEDPERGINYLDFIFSKQTTLSQTEAYLKSKILQIPGNRELTEFELETGKDRHLTAKFRVRTDLNEDTEVSVPLEEIKL